MPPGKRAAEARWSRRSLQLKSDVQEIRTRGFDEYIIEMID